MHESHFPIKSFEKNRPTGESTITTKDKKRKMQEPVDLIRSN